MQSLGLRDECPVPGETLWLVRSWEQGRCYRSPVQVLNETLAERGRKAYEFLLAEILKVLRKRLGVQPGVNVHVVVRPGWTFAPYPAIRQGEDTLQAEGFAIIHPLPREA